MARYLRLTSVACALALSGCNLGYLETVYNQTACPIWVKHSLLHDWADADRTSVDIAPGDRLVRLAPHREQKFDWIVVIDHDNVEHRYDADKLAALRSPKDATDNWGYTDSGLVYLHGDPKQRDLNANLPCGASSQSLPAIS